VIPRHYADPIEHYFTFAGGKSPDPITKAAKARLSMRNKLLLLPIVALYAAFLASAANPALAQSGDSKPAGAASDPAKPRSDEFAEARRAIVGPAGEPECVWLGRRVVGLIYRDDPDNAQRNLDIYDRFRCPASHIQEAFRCVVRQGNPDQKSPEVANAKINDRIHACWLNPAMPNPPAASASTPTGAATTTR
jgi:hypothetical protein